ncbi:MAG TPA: glycoside hydrolase family 15 protein, partial [Herpetosiphonaceae bacterium]
DRPLSLGVWSPGRQTGVGTAFTYGQHPDANTSPVWFGLTDGAITLGAYPRVDQANLKELRPLLLTPEGKLIDLTLAVSQTVRRPEPRLPFWSLQAADPAGRWAVTTEVVADPQRPSIVAQWRLDAPAGDFTSYRLFLYLVPALGSSGEGDAALAAADGLVGAVDAQRKVALALRSARGWDAASAGYVQRNDGLVDLADGDLDWSYTSAGPGGRVALVTELGPADHWTVALGFGTDLPAADANARASLGQPFERVAEAYRDGWRGYVEQLSDLERVPAAVRDLAYLSATEIKLHEDKQQRGAIIASSAVPWGANQTDAADQPGYRQIRTRDLYHAAMALLAAGDSATVNAIVSYMDLSLQRADGSIAAAAPVAGPVDSSAGGIDATALPILLAWQLNDLDRYQSLVKPAADYLLDNGPATPADRWGGPGGYVPSALAAEISALACAADLAGRANDPQGATAYAAAAAEWRSRLADWLLATKGPLGDGRYLLRASSGDPAATQPLTGAIAPAEQIDPSALELARLGVLPAADPLLAATLPEIDAALKVETARGPAWRRFPGDEYGEASRNDLTLKTGRLWPLLTGERAMYELQAGDAAAAERLLATLAAFAGPGGLLPEQVWEDTGEPTQAASPLIWSHAELIVLARSVGEGRAFDTPDAVREILGE